MSINDAAARLRRGELTATTLVEHYLERIATLQPKLNAFITVTAEKALATAAVRDAELKAGRDRGALHGIPIVHKDCFDTAGIPTTAGSNFLRQRTPHSDATIVHNLHEAGAIMLGKTNMNEFAAGMSGKNSAYGDVCNPWNPMHAPGGSSSGSAVAVAAGLCLGATGTDSGGSIRVPASWNNIVGLRPSLKRTNMAGVLGRSWSFDCAAPLAHTAGDAALLMNAMAGLGVIDTRSMIPPTAIHAIDVSQGMAGLRFAMIDNFSLDGATKDVTQAIETAVDALACLGAEIRHVEIPALSREMDYGAVFDVLLYEFNQIWGSDYRSCPDREHLFGTEVQDNFRRGEKISEATYRAALATRDAFTMELRRIFSETDALLTPCTPYAAPRLDASAEAFDRARQFTIPFSFVGLPAITVPCGFDHGGLPLGLQIIGDQLKETLLVQIAASLENTASAQSRRPML